MIMHNKSTTITVVLIASFVFFLFLGISSFRNVKKAELDFNQKKAILVKENLDLKDRFDSLQETIIQKTEALSVVEKEKAALEEQLNVLKKAAMSFRVASNKELEALKKKTLALNKKISVLENSSIVQKIKKAIGREENESIKKVLEDSIDKIDMIREGKSVNLEPIIITKKESATPPSVKEKNEAIQAKEGKDGIVLSVDRKNNLIVINLGHNDGVKEGYRCEILKDGQAIGSGETMSARYKVSAVFIDDFQYKATMDDIKEGFKVIIRRNQ